MQDSLIDFFRNTMNEQGYKVHKAEIIPVQDSRYAVTDSYGTKTVPYLKVFSLGEETYNLLKGAHENAGLVNNEQAGIIRNLWLESCRKYGASLEQLYDKKMYIGIDRIETYVYAKYAYENKAAIEREVVKIIGCRPCSVYASSTPGIHVVFETEDYMRYQVETHMDELITGIKIAAEHFICEQNPNLTITNVLQVKIWHPKMYGYDGYGLARED